MFAEQSSVLLPRSRPYGRRLDRDRKRSASASPDIGRSEFLLHIVTILYSGRLFSVCLLMILTLGICEASRFESDDSDSKVTS